MNTIHIICASRNLNRLRLYMSKSVICFISAFRSQYSLEENLRRQKRMSEQLLGIKFGWITLNGNWESSYDGGSVHESYEEKTFAVINNSKYCQRTTGEFIADMSKLAMEYSQDAILIVVPTCDGDFRDPAGNVLSQGHGYYYSGDGWSSPVDMGVFSTSAVEEWVKGDDGSYHRGYSEIKGKGFKFASSVGSALVVSSLRYADCGTGPMFYLESRSILSHIKRIRSGDSSGYFKDSYSSYNEYSDVQPEPVHPSEEGRLTFGGSIKGPFHGGRSLPGLMDREIN